MTMTLSPEIGLTKFERGESIITVAKSWATLRHYGQEYGDGLPFVYHLNMVADYVDAWTCHNADLMAAAWLHDVVEDTDTTVGDVDKIFGSHIASVVDFCTDQPGHNRAERKDKTHERIARSLDAQIVKVADRMANVESCIRFQQRDLGKMYVKEWPAFRVGIYNPVLADVWWRMDHSMSRLTDMINSGGRKEKALT